MTFTGNKYQLDLSTLPTAIEALRVRFDAKVVNGKNKILYLYPNGEPGYEKRCVRFATGLMLTLADGTVAQNQGQLVVTGHRLLGMITSGSVGKMSLDESSGAIYAFAIDRDDLQPYELKKNWRGNTSQVRLQSKSGLEPRFQLNIFSMVASLNNDGTTDIVSFPALLSRLSADGRQAFL